MEVESSINSTQPIMNNQFAKQKTLINLGKGIQNCQINSNENNNKNQWIFKSDARPKAR